MYKGSAVVKLKLKSHILVLSKRHSNALAFVTQYDLKTSKICDSISCNILLEIV